MEESCLIFGKVEINNIISFCFFKVYHEFQSEKRVNLKGLSFF